MDGFGKLSALLLLLCMYNTAVKVDAACDIKCEAIDKKIADCPYDYAGFPNAFGHQDIQAAYKEAGDITLVEAARCYDNSREFLCRLLLPECKVDEKGTVLGLMFPDRDTCNGFVKGCKGLLDMLKMAGKGEIIPNCNDYAVEPVPQCNIPTTANGKYGVKTNAKYRVKKNSKDEYQSLIQKRKIFR